MKSAVENVSPTRAKLNVEVPFEELKPSIDAAYKAIATQTSARLPQGEGAAVPDALKGAIEAAADAAAQSVNAWLVQAARSALNRGGDPRRRGAGNRISGFARS